jgi:hypothetical protein
MLPNASKPKSAAAERYAVAADRFAREIVGILTLSCTARLRRQLKRRPLGAYQTP